MVLPVLRRRRSVGRLTVALLGLRVVRLLLRLVLDVVRLRLRLGVLRRRGRVVVLLLRLARVVMSGGDMVARRWVAVLRPVLARLVIGVVRLGIVGRVVGRVVLTAVAAQLLLLRRRVVVVGRRARTLRLTATAQRVEGVGVEVRVQSDGEVSGLALLWH